jgi:hypothetical protein
MEFAACIYWSATSGVQEQQRLVRGKDCVEGCHSQIDSLISNYFTMGGNLGDMGLFDRRSEGLVRWSQIFAFKFQYLSIKTPHFQPLFTTYQPHPNAYSDHTPTSLSSSGCPVSLARASYCPGSPSAPPDPQCPIALGG